MEHRLLGRSGVGVSPLCLGTMMFGTQTDEAEAARIVDSARAAGINFIDTADVYGDGVSEGVTGRQIARDRHRWVLATKAGNRMGADPNRRGSSRRWLLQAAEASLQRLGTDHIDLYYIHRDDRATPLEETVGALGDLIRAGKIRYWGISNFRAWRLAEACAVADRLGVPRPVATQPLYNAVTRQAEVEHLPAAAHHGLGAVVYSPLARGVLSAKYDPDAPPPEGTRAGRRDSRLMETEWRPESLRIARTIAAHAAARGTTAARFAVAWALRNSLVTAAIAGPRTLAQWEEYLAALEVRLTAEDEALVDRLVAPGHASTHGFTDPAYPLEGRLALR